MDFVLQRGREFREEFDFKNTSGQIVSLPPGTYTLKVERGSFVRQYTVGNGLYKQRGKIIWRLPESETASFEYSTMYYELKFNERELARGIIRVQQ
jgi:hypothetical protein